MADLRPALNGSGGVAFLVSGGIVFEIIAFACSSPQTAEINIETRGDTLMKWVHLGEALAVVFIYIAARIDKARAVPIVAGGVVGLLAAESFYRYAEWSGHKNPGPGTETW